MRWLMLAAVLMVGGCASTDVGPTPAELKAQWDAQNVFPQNYKGDLLAFLRTYLNDPTHMRGAAVSPPQLKRVGPGDRYVACVRYNARDSDGKYAGVKDGAATYVSGKLDRFLDGPQDVQRLLQGRGLRAVSRTGKAARASARKSCAHERAPRQSRAPPGLARRQQVQTKRPKVASGVEVT